MELTGFEPVTFSMPLRRATNCAIAPDVLNAEINSNIKAYLFVAIAINWNRKKPQNPPHLQTA